jgi:predicted metal-dependent hydrolase
MNIPVMVMKRLSVVRYNVRVCNAEEFTKAVSEVEDLIISTIEKVYAGCRKYRIIGNKPSLSRVVVKCNEGTFILRLRPFSYNCTGWLEKQLATVGIDVRVKSYAYKFAAFVKELVATINNNPLIQLRFVDGYVGSNP